MKLFLAVLAGCGFLLPWWWFRSHRRQLLLAYGAFVLALVLAELALRVLAPQQHQHDDLFVYDAKLGWRFRPDQKRYHGLFRGSESSGTNQFGRLPRSLH